MLGMRRRAGWLGPQVDGYQAWFRQREYSPDTIRMLKELGQGRPLVVGKWPGCGPVERGPDRESKDLPAELLL